MGAARSAAYAPVVQLFNARPDSWVPIRIIHSFVEQSGVKITRQALKTALSRCAYVDRWLDEARGADIGGEYHRAELHYRVRPVPVTPKREKKRRA